MKKLSGHPVHFLVDLRLYHLVKASAKLHPLIQLHRADLYDLERNLLSLLFFFLISLIPFQVQYDIIHEHRPLFVYAFLSSFFSSFCAISFMQPASKGSFSPTSGIILVKKSEADSLHSFR